MRYIRLFSDFDFYFQGQRISLSVRLMRVGFDFASGAQSSVVHVFVHGHHIFRVQSYFFRLDRSGALRSVFRSNCNDYFGGFRVRQAHKADTLRFCGHQHFRCRCGYGRAFISVVLHSRIFASQNRLGSRLRRGQRTFRRYAHVSARARLGKAVQSDYRFQACGAYKHQQSANQAAFSTRRPAPSTTALRLQTMSRRAQWQSERIPFLRVRRHISTT